MKVSESHYVLKKHKRKMKINSFIFIHFHLCWAMNGTAFSLFLCLDWIMFVFFVSLGPFWLFYYWRLSKIGRIDNENGEKCILPPKHKYVIRTSKTSASIAFFVFSLTQKKATTTTTHVCDPLRFAFRIIL